MRFNFNLLVIIILWLIFGWCIGDRNGLGFAALISMIFFWIHVAYQSYRYLKFQEWHNQNQDEL